MTFDADETSIEDSQPRDGYEFVFPAATWRLTPGTRDVVIDGHTYYAGTIKRGEARPSTTDGSPGEMEIEMVVSHAAPQRYLRGGIPPDTIVVNVYRKQTTSGEYELTWSGVVTSMACEGSLARFLVAQRLSDAIPRRIPTISVGKDCPHVLYDGNCGLDRDDFRVDTTIALVNGRDITVASVGGNPDSWFQFGELLHVASGERRSINTQLGTSLQLLLPIPDMQSGDAVQIFAGCDHTIATCEEKFDNRQNFGGFPKLPKRNPFVSNGYGISEQE